MKFDIEIKTETLYKAGYKQQHNGFVRYKNGGRFHIIIKSYYKRHEYKEFIDIHFDFFFREDKHPSVFYTPELLKEEIKRIQSFI